MSFKFKIRAFVGLFGRLADTKAKRIVLLLLLAFITLQRRIRLLYNLGISSAKIHPISKPKETSTIEEKHYELKEEISHRYTYPNQALKGIPITQDILTISCCGYTPINGLFRCILSHSKWSNNANFCLQNAVSVRIVYDALKHKNIYHSEWDVSVKRCWILSDINRTTIYYAAPQLNDEFIPNDKHWISVNGTSPTPQIHIAHIAMDKVLRYEELASKNQLLNEKNETLTQLNAKHDELLSGYKHKMEVLTKTNEELMAQNKELRGKNSALNEQNIDNNSIHIQMKRENERLVNNYNSLVEKLGKFVNKPVESDRVQNQQENARLEQTKLLLEQKRQEELAQQKQNIEDQKRRLAKLITEQEQISNEMTRQRQELQEQQRKLEQEQIGYEEKRKQFEKEMQNMRNKLSDQQTIKTVELEQQQQNLDNELQKLTDLRTQMEHEQEILKKQIQDDKKALETEKIKLQQERQQMQDELDGKQKHEAETQRKLQQQQVQLNNEKNDYFNICNNKIQQLEDKITSKNAEIAVLKIQNDKYTASAEKLRRKLFEVEETEAAIMNAYMTNTQDNEELKKDNELLKKQNSILTVSCEDNSESKSLNDLELNSAQSFNSLNSSEKDDMDGQEAQYANWVHDKGTNACYKCRSKFNAMYRRKHHCRSCGQIFCDGCSKNKMQLQQFGHQELVRVCDECYMVQSQSPKTIASRNSSITTFES